MNPMDFIPGLVPSSGLNPFSQQTYLPGGYSLPSGQSMTPQQTQQYDQWFMNVGRWLTPGQHPTMAGGGGPAKPAPPSGGGGGGATPGPTGGPVVTPLAGQSPQATNPFGNTNPAVPFYPGAVSSSTQVPRAAGFGFMPNISVPQAGPGSPAGLQPPLLNQDYAGGVKSMGPPTGSTGSPLGAHRPLVANPDRRNVAVGPIRLPNWDAKFRR